MPGLTFDDGPAPDPEAPLVVWLDEWVESIARHSRRTVAGYVADVAGFGLELLGVVDKPAPALLGDRGRLRELAGAADIVARARRFGFKEASYVRAAEVFTWLVLADLHPKNLARAVNRHSANHADATTRRAATAWSSYCRYLVGQQVLASNPMDAPAIELPSRPAPDPSPLSYAEVERVFRACVEEDPRARVPWPTRDLAAAAIFVATGVRLEEAITATVADFFDEADVGTRLRVMGKGRRPRVIPVYDEAGEVVRIYLKDRELRLGVARPEEPLLVRADGRAFSPSAMHRLVERWYARAGVRRKPGTCAHALRHSFGTQALNSGASITEVQRLMGHLSLETTKRYLDVVGGGLEQAVAAHASREMLRRATHEGPPAATPPTVAMPAPPRQGEAQR